jgi:GNAT superfamily N-acetyltransferase
MGEVLVRPAGAEDLPGIRAVLAAHGDDDEPGAPVDVVGPTLAHLLATGRLAVAQEDGRVVGFGAVAETELSTHLCDLFVLPDRLGGGIGRRLLDHLFDRPGPRTTFASDDPRALPLYVRCGMAAHWPNLYLDGDPARLPPVDPGITVEPAGPERLAELELAWIGMGRPGDHAHWSALPEARPFVVVLDGEPVATVHARRRRRGVGRWIERAVVAPSADPVAPLLAAFAHAAGVGPIGGCIPGPNPALRPLLERGFRIVDHDTFLASPDVELDATRFMPDPGLL